MRKKERRFWLFKSEPDAFGFDDLRARPDQTEHWDGVRNYQARNLLRDEVAIGDRVLFYHSRTEPPHVAGVAEVVRAGYPDHTAWDPQSRYYDAGSTEDAPRWYMVDVRAVGPLPQPVALSALKANPLLSAMKVVQRGQRLSVQPVTADEFAEVLRMGGWVEPRPTAG